MGLKIELLYDFTLSGHIETLNMTANSLQTYFQTSVKVNDLAKKVSALEQPMLLAINSQLLTGKQLTVRKQLRNDFSETQMFIYDNYLMIEMCPPMKAKLQKQMNKLKEEAKKAIAFKQQSEH